MSFVEYSTVQRVGTSLATGLVGSLNDLDGSLRFALYLPPSPSTKLEILWRTMLGDSDATGSTTRTCPASKDIGLRFQTYVSHKIVAALRLARKQGLQDATFWKSNSTYLELIQNKELPSQAAIEQMASEMAAHGLDESTFETEVNESLRLEEQQNICMGRRFFTTACGNLGLGPRSSQKGDIVAFIRNCKIPMILRKRASGRYIVIGEAYIHGYMHGEFLERGHPSFEKIIIQ